ncbi:hypothetical protein [Pseudomonas sp. CGJS7]|uniref:hypothetical protein n=1 Tax=Pseudomonas sp. CGJS7 TaxID=3109348 RepID=UPI003008692A
MTIDATRATQVLDQSFARFDTAKQNDVSRADQKISQDDLQVVADNSDGRFSAEEVEAAKFLIGSDAARGALDVGAGKGWVDGTISRKDLDATLSSIKDGSFERRILDTAAGRGGADGNISADDIDAALKDPGVPQSLKDAVSLMRQGFTGSESEFNDALNKMNHDSFAAAAELYNSAEFKQLSCVPDQATAAQAVRDAGGDAGAIKDLQQLVKDPSFQALDAAQKSNKLNEFGLQQSPEFKSLPASEQKLITDALAARKSGDTDQAANIAKLIKNEDFQDLSAEEKTAVLSQVKNYPDERSIANLDRLMGKDWFQDFDLGDKQRTLKAISFLAQNDAGDPQVNKNTLERVLSPDSDYVFKWDDSFNGDINSSGGLYGTADGTNITFNAKMVNDGNGPLTETYNSKHVVLHTIAHEVNHNVNGDEVSETYGYLEQEYRAWYTGFKSEFGRPPNNEEAMERWRNEITGAYSGTSQPAIDSSPEEARKFAEELSLMTGQPVPANASHDELKQFIQDQVQLPVKDYADATGAAPVPPGNKTNE